MKTILLFLVLIFLISGCIRNINCGSNIQCFRNNAETCSKSRFSQSHDGSEILITLRGVSNEQCGISFKIINISNEIKNKYPEESTGLKGKILNCFVPIKYKNSNNWLELVDMPEKLNDYCSGQIKDLAKDPLKEVLKKELETILIK